MFNILTLSGCVLKEHSYLGSYTPSTHRLTPPTCHVLQVMLTGDMAIWPVCRLRTLQMIYQLFNCEMVSQIKTPGVLICQQVCIRESIWQ